MNLETNKSTVVAFYDLMFNKCQPAEAIRRYVGATYTQHDVMPEPVPGIDFANLPAPNEGIRSISQAEPHAFCLH
jgi:hypothetical protein